MYDFIYETKSNGASCVAVQHVTRSSVPLIKTLLNIFGENLLTCAKPNSIDKKIWRYLETLGIRIKIALREINDPIKYYEIKNEEYKK